MRVAAKRRASWGMAIRCREEHEERVSVRAGWVQVARFGEGSPIVLIPGLAGGWRLLAPLAQRLASRHSVFICGLRGDGRPFSRNLATDLTVYAEDVATVIDHFGLERPAIMGVSFGAAVALELASGYPGRVGALIVQGAEATFETSLGSRIARRVLERYSLPTDNGFLNQFFHLLHGGKPKSQAFADFLVERCWETDQSVMAHRLALLETFDLSDRLWSIEAPTLVLAGSRDVIVPPFRQKQLAGSIAGARFEMIEGAGHVAFLTHRGEVARHVVRMLREAKHSPC